MSEPRHPVLALPAPAVMTAFGDHSEAANVPVVVKKHFWDLRRLCSVIATGIRRVNYPH